MMKVSCIALVAALGLVSCGPREAPEIGAAKAAVRTHLRDPNSADFRNIHEETAETGERVVCGEVNSKNAFGGMAGYTQFYYGLATKDAHLLDMTDLPGRVEYEYETWPKRCRPIQ